MNLKTRTMRLQCTRVDSQNLRLYCSQCKESVDKLIAEKLQLILKYLQKIDLVTQKQEESHCAMSTCIQSIATTCKTLSKNIVTVHNRVIERESDNISKPNTPAKPSFASILRQAKKPVVIIKPKNGTQKCSDTIGDIKQQINYKDVQACGIRNIRNGGIVVNCDSNNSTLKMKQLIENKFGEKYDVNLPPIKKPRVKIRDICDEIDDDKIIDEIKHQNEYLKDASIEIKKKITRKDKPIPYDLVIEIDYINYKELMKVKSINVGWKRCKVIDHIHISRCYKCCGFSHISVNCSNKVTCSKCAGEHKYSECKSDQLKCINCAQANEKFNLKLDCNHHAMSYKCETLQRKLLQFSKNIQFSEAK